MDYKEKYEELVEAARAVVEGNPGLCNMNKRLGRVRDLLPEKESEDEKIRKEIIEFIDWTELRGSVRNDWHQKKRPAEWIAYLEKKKEQDVKVISWREPDDCADIPEGHYVVIAYKPGVFGLGYIGNSKVVCAPGQKPSGILYIPNADESIIVESKEQQPAEYIKRNSKEWHSLLAEQWDKGFWKGKAEQKPTEWSERDKDMLNSIIWGVHMKSIKPLDEMDERSKYEKYEDFLKSLPERFNLPPKQEWSEEDEQWLESIIKDYEDSLVKDKDHAAVIKIKIDFLKSIRPQQKQEWSKEDEKFFKACVRAMRTYEGNDTPISKWIEALKDRVRPQPHWKPSEEQIQALTVAIDEAARCEEPYWRDSLHDVLLSLHTDLKKLF